MGSWKAKGALLIVLAGVVAAILVVLAGALQPEADMITLTAEVPQRLCFDPEAKGMPDLLAGRKLPVLAVLAYDPAIGVEGQILVTLVGTRQSTRIGFFPGGAFSAGSAADARKSYPPRALDMPVKNYCYELTLLGGEGATALVDLEISDPLEN
jgi:hypothetical protein